MTMEQFDVVSIRSGEPRTVYKVTESAHPRFLIYRDGEWVWEDSRWYKPVKEVAG